MGDQFAPYSSCIIRLAPTNGGGYTFFENALRVYLCIPVQSASGTPALRRGKSLWQQPATPRHEFVLIGPGLIRSIPRTSDCPAMLHLRRFSSRSGTGNP